MMQEEWEELLEGAAETFPNEASPEWAALQDWFQERNDCRWIAVAFFRLASWVPAQQTRDGESRYVADGLPAWWESVLPVSVRRQSYFSPGEFYVYGHRRVQILEGESTSLEVYRLVLLAFKRLYHHGSVPGMFLYAQGVRDLPEAFFGGQVTVEQIAKAVWDEPVSPNQVQPGWNEDQATLQEFATRESRRLNNQAMIGSYNESVRFFRQTVEQPTEDTPE